MLLYLDYDWAFPHTDKSKVPVVDSGNTRVKWIKAYLANAQNPPHRKPALPLVFASVQPIWWLSLAWLSGCHFLLYLLCIVIYFVSGFLVGGGLVFAISSARLVSIFHHQVVLEIFIFVSCGMSYVFQSSLF